MSEEEINIVIAESVGWHPHPDNDKRKQKFWTYGGGGYGLPNGCDKRKAANPPIHDGAWENISGLPDYCNDLNAMHEAEMTLPNEIYDEYWNQLVFVCMNEGEERMNSASAKLRAKAFAITIGKWKE